MRIKKLCQVVKNMRTIDILTHQLGDAQRAQLNRAIDHFRESQNLIELHNCGEITLPIQHSGRVDVFSTYNMKFSNKNAIIVTGIALDDNWFSHVKNGIGLITLADWGTAFLSKSSRAVSSPDAHILTSIILTGLLCLAQDVGDFDVLHEDCTGCLFDFCQIKSERIIKMRSGFVCSSCTAKLAQHGLSSVDIDAAHSILDRVRHLVLGRNPQKQLPKHSDIDAFIETVGDTDSQFLPTGLINACRDKKITVLVGSGLSLQSDVKISYDKTLSWSKLPTWTETLDRLSQRLASYTGRNVQPRETQTLDEFLAELESFRIFLGPDLYYPKAIFDIFTPKIESVGIVHQLLFKLPLEAVLTTNYDFVLQYAAPVGSPVFTWKEAKSARAYLHSGSGQVPIIKIHGCGSRPETIVLGRYEYENIRNDHEYLSLIKNLFDQRTILFLGFGFNDPRDLDGILAEMHLAGAASAEKFAILPPNKCIEVRDRFPQIQTISIDNYNKLANIIASLIIKSGKVK